MCTYVSRISRRGEQEYISPASLCSLCQKCTLAHSTCGPRDVGGRVHPFCKWIRGGSSGFLTRSRVGPCAPKKIYEWRRRSGAVKRRGLNERKKMFTETEERQREREERERERVRGREGGRGARRTLNPSAALLVFIFCSNTRQKFVTLCYIAVWQSG